MLPSGSLVGCNPYEMWPQIRVICDSLGIELGSKPTPEEIQRLFSTLGKGKVYGANAEELAIGDEIYSNPTVIQSIEEMLAAVEPRSVHRDARPRGAVVVLGTGATANWMVRRAREAYSHLFGARGGMDLGKLFLVGGNRLMEDKAGPPNPFILEYMEENEGQPPLEWQVLVRIWHSAFGHWPDDIVHESDDLDKNIVALARKHPELAGATIYAPFNAAAVDKAIQTRAKLREVFPEFDSGPEKPQFIFSSDSFPVAYDPEHGAAPASYQRPKTFLSAIPRYVKQFHELDA
jgi:hypothetical protein